MSEKILVVDDDYSLRTMVEINLQNHGYQALGVSTGTIALELFCEWNPDLVILDIMMPDMDGFTTTRRIREFSSIPIIMLTAKGQEQDVIEGLEAGADDYIIKPFSTEELLARIRAVLRRSSSQAADELHQTIFRQDGLVIDTDQARVTMDGEEIHLSVTEFQLLVKLASSKGSVLTREELLSSVWGPEYRTDKNILWITISRLRKKIEPDPQNPRHIVNCKNIGYMMP